MEDGNGCVCAQIKGGSTKEYSSSGQDDLLPFVYPLNLVAN